MMPFRRATLLAATAVFLQAVSPVAADDTAGDAATVRIEYLPLSGPPRLLYQNAKKALAAGNPQKAIEDLNEAIRQRPDAGELRTALVDALQAAGRNEEAQRTARAAAKDTRIDPASRRRLLAKAKAFSRDIAQVDASSAKTKTTTKPAAAAETSRNTGQAPDGKAEDAGLDDDTARRLSELATRIRRERAQEADDAESVTKRAAAETSIGTKETLADEANVAEPDDGAIRRLSELAAKIRRERAEKASAGEITAKPWNTETAPAPLSTEAPAYKAADAAYRAYERGDYEKAVADAEEAVRYAPENSDYQKLLDNSRAALAEASAKDTTRQVSRASGQDDQATQEDTELDDEASSENVAITTDEPAYKAADAAYRAYESGDYRQAVVDAQDAVRLAPDNSNYRALLENAEKALAQANEKPAVSSPAAKAAQKAYAALRRDDTQVALSHAWQAARNAPDNRTYQVLLIDVLNRNDMQEEALRVADAAIARNGEDRTLLSQRGVIRQELGDQAGARADFERALAMQGPKGDETQLRLNLAAAAMATDAPELANQALAPLGDSDDINVWLARGKALTATADFSAAAEALEKAEPLAKSKRQRADVAVVRLDLVLAEYGKNPARTALRTAEDEGVLSPLSSTETAYLADRVGDRSLAYNAFSEADETGQLNGVQYIDAAYAARRNYQNDVAIVWLKRAIDEADDGTLSLTPTELFALRRSVSDISRRWGANTGLFYGSSGIADGFVAPAPSAGRTAQLGTEFYWRPPVIGYRDGRTIDLFIRQFTTLYDSLDGAVGASTTQGAFGLRLKPFTNANFTLEAARYFKIGRYSRNDYLLRGAISGGFNTDLIVSSRQWWAAQYYAEAGRYFQSNENFASANARFGRSFSLGDGGRFIVTPFIGVSADYGDTYATAFGLGAGPGLNLRYWFRETKYQAPMSYIDLSLQYRAKLYGDDRASGWFGSLNLIL